MHLMSQRWTDPTFRERSVLTLLLLLWRTPEEAGSAGKENVAFTVDPCADKVQFRERGKGRTVFGTMYFESVEGEMINGFSST